ncbi:tryptophan synthase subunit alpha [Salibacterium halotolerans]|uniref:Tryptophan synthase alpha chain n=1 Tax=Salibacterium halotolerans TaxID=1884432 RepID=A0A1I5Q7K7_9BACI|nr:tryptophan synthase subunit alpha [Salibacterium halotolerans]SFP42030.1 tryptophan synthase, alpha chain [Salibacterium halotolerans]
MSGNNVQKAAERAHYPLFIPFIMAGDPDQETTVDLALKLEEAGAHILELGIPYSDPLADGPLLQRSASRALQSGMSLRRALELIPVMRERGLTIPVIAFTYYNPVLQMGEQHFFDQIKENGGDGALIPDLPYEESRDIHRLAGERGLVNISLAAPTSGNRIEKIAAEAEGFLYCVSSLGVTGTRDNFPPEAYSFIEKVKRNSSVPVAAGFGISNPSQVKSLEGVCDGVIVGSAIMKKVEENLERLQNPEEKSSALDAVKSFVSSLISS